MAREKTPRQSASRRRKKSKTRDKSDREGRARRTKARRPARTSCLYVIELDPAILERPRFRKKNPDYTGKFPCVYVGHTYLTPDERFQQHSEGHRLSSWATRDYAKGLLPGLTGRDRYKTRELAEAAERDLAIRLRKKGYAVWQN